MGIIDKVCVAILSICLVVTTGFLASRKFREVVYSILESGQMCPLIKPDDGTGVCK